MIGEKHLIENNFVYRSELFIANLRAQKLNRRVDKSKVN